MPSFIYINTLMDIDLIFVLGPSASGKTHSVENELLKKYPEYDTV